MKLVGIVNYASNSASSKLLGAEIILKKIRDLFEEGADIVEINFIVNEIQEEELSLLEQCLKINKNIGVNSNNLDLLKKAVTLNIEWVSGHHNILELVDINPNLQYVLKYMPAEPPKHYRDVMQWIIDKVDKCNKIGIDTKRLIFDPNIGVSLNSLFSIDVLKNIYDFKKLGIAIKIQHSRHNFLSIFNCDNITERDVGTLSISTYLIQQEGIDYIAVHNVKWHKKALNIFNYLQ